MSEKNVYGTFKAGIAGKATRIDRIENLRVDGMPDVNVCISGRESWVEIKSPREPVRPATPLFGSNHKLSIDQKNWFKNQIQSKGNCYVLIRTDRRCLLLHGKYADDINDMPVDLLEELADWKASVPTRKENWKELRDVLKHGTE